MLTQIYRIRQCEECGAGAKQSGNRDRLLRFARNDGWKHNS